MGVSRGALSFPLLPAFLLGCAAFLAGRGSGSSSHSMRYVYTAVSEPGQKVPQFFIVGYVDDQEFLSYDAKTRKYISKVPWMTKVEKEDPQYAEWNNQYFRNSEQVFRVDLVNVPTYYNQSGGTHTWQWMYGCELRRDGSRGGHMQYAYDGRDYISLDKETLTWTAADVPAQNTKRKWEREIHNAQFQKAYLEGTCIEWLQKYLEYGKETLLRTGTHTWQLMVGCELRRDGSKGGYYQYAYDGRDYISLDKETLTWTAADVPAQNTKRKWEAEPAFAQYNKAYLEETCIEWLQKYLEYGKGTLLRTEVPEVTVTRKADYDGMETLICRVGGFYPKEIDITWTKDGEVWMEDTYHGLVSPNSDGTYYTWWSIMVDPKEKEHYKCHVEHDGFLEPVDVAWEEPVSPSDSNLRAIIAYVSMGVLVVLLGAEITMCFKKRQNGFKAVSVSDQGSNSSGTGSAVPI